MKYQENRENDEKDKGCNGGRRGHEGSDLASFKKNARNLDLHNH